jgi:uncharacterized membrane protein YphA (DoxX/SURF4 family)
LPATGEWMSGISESILKMIYRPIFGDPGDQVLELVSDSTGHYLFVFSLAIFSVITAVVVHFIWKNKMNSKKLIQIGIIIISYYLAVQLLSYGLNKIFKWQFYFPEPNTLYTRVGDMPRDILYWTTMGTSHRYSVFAGLIEVIPAVLLLFKQTRLIGALVAFGVLLNVVMINFSFDISVKLHSLFLIFCSAMLIYHSRQRLLLLIPGRQLNIEPPIEPLTFPYKNATKTFLVLWILADGFSPYVKTGNYNDDLWKVGYPVFHGAYEIPWQYNQSLTVGRQDYRPWKRVFVHRKNYFIVQYEDESTIDYVLQEDTINGILKLKNYYDNTNWQLNYRYTPDSLLILTGILDSVQINVHLFQLPWWEMKLNDNEFHWRIDE